MPYVPIIHALPITEEYLVMGALLHLPGVSTAEFTQRGFDRVVQVSFDSRLSPEKILAHLRGTIAPQAQLAS